MAENEMNLDVAEIRIISSEHSFTKPKYSLCEMCILVSVLMAVCLACGLAGLMCGVLLGVNLGVEVCNWYN